MSSNESISRSVAAFLFNYSWFLACKIRFLKFRSYISLINVKEFCNLWLPFPHDISLTFVIVDKFALNMMRLGFFFDK